MSTLTPDEVTRLARLSQLTLSDEELKSYPQQLEESIAYVHNLATVDTSGVPETFFTTDAHNVMDEDVVDPTCMLTQEQALKNASSTRKGYFIVKRIL